MKTWKHGIIGIFAVGIIAAIAITACQKKNAQDAQDIEIAALQAELQEAQAALETARSQNLSAEEIKKLEAAVAEIAEQEEEAQAERRRSGRSSERGRSSESETAEQTGRRRGGSDGEEASSQAVEWDFIDLDNVVEGETGFVTKGFIQKDDTNGDYVIVFSRDGTDWIAANTPFPANHMYPKFVAYGRNIFVAAGYQHRQDVPPPPNNFMAAYSVDGINWTKAVCPLPNQTSVSGITFDRNNRRFVLEGMTWEGEEFPYTNTEVTAISTDGRNWTVQ